jgi:hypothetical protein
MLLQLRACIDDLDAGPINDGSPGLLALCSVLENIFNFGFITKCVSVFVRLSTRLSACVSVCLSYCLPVRPSRFHLSVRLFVYQSVRCMLTSSLPKGALLNSWHPANVAFLKTLLWKSGWRMATRHGFGQWSMRPCRACGVLHR